MNARRKKPSARATAARKPAVSRSHSAKAAAKQPASTAVGKRSAGAARKGKGSTTTLGSDCTIEHSPGLHKQLAKIITDRACVTLDFAAVKRSDTAGLQVLAAFIRERREAGREVQLASVPDNFLATARLLGLSALFSPVTDDGSCALVGHA